MDTGITFSFETNANEQKIKLNKKRSKAHRENTKNIVLEVLKKISGCQGKPIAEITEEVNKIQKMSSSRLVTS